MAAMECAKPCGPVVKIVAEIQASAMKSESAAMKAESAAMNSSRDLQEIKDIVIETRDTTILLKDSLYGEVGKPDSGFIGHYQTGHADHEMRLKNVENAVNDAKHSISRVILAAVISFLTALIALLLGQKIVIH